MSRTRQPRRGTTRCVVATPAHVASGVRLLCTSRSPLAELRQPATARRLFNRRETRAFDLLDVALANEMLDVAGLHPLTADPIGTDLVAVSAHAGQATILRAVSASTAPEVMEAWMLSLAPRLTRDVIAIVGDGWLPEAELSVELALALRADDISDLADQLLAGPVDVESALSAAAVIAVDVPDPALIQFV
jgi:hypothetical protein